MINLILHYLLGLPDVATATPQVTSNSVSKARKRKSMDLATMMASKVDDAADPLLFTLVDLILACLRSSSHQTIHVTLQLVSAILKRHHRYAVMTLVKTENLYGDVIHRTVGAQQQELEYLMSLASGIGGQDNFDEVYENILRDTTARIDCHPCSLILTAPKVSTANHDLPTVPDSLPGAPREVRAHTIRADDPLLSTLLDHLELFFVNPVETNLSITETIFDLALCGFMNIEGWLLRAPEKYIYDNDDSYRPPSPTEPKDSLDLNTEDVLSDDPTKIDQINQCRRRPVWSSSDLPRFLNILQALSDQVNVFRVSIPRFSDLLQQRRESFQIADSPPPAPTQVQPPQQSTPSQSTSNFSPSSVHTSRSTSPIRAGIEGFAQRLLKDLNELGTPSRSNTTRGRPLGMYSHGGGYGIGTPSSVNKPPPVPPKDSPRDTPSKGGAGNSRPFTPVGSQKPDEDPIKASQAAAFQAIDQQILARKVGISTAKKAESAPLQLGGKIEDESSKNGENTGEGEDKPPPPPAKDDQLPDGQARGSLAGVGGGSTPTSILSPERGGAKVPPQDKKVSVSHVLTNVIILQSFLFELAALVQVRAGLFDEVRYI